MILAFCVIIKDNAGNYTVTKQFTFVWDIWRYVICELRMRRECRNDFPATDFKGNR